MVRRSRLEDASKTGYTFNGWYLEAGFENEIETIDTSLLQNYNLYAKFTINQYTMTFNTNGGSEISSITQDYNSAVVRPSDPTRDGYEFRGWYTDNNTFLNKYLFTTMPANEITVYARFIIIPSASGLYQNGHCVKKPELKSGGYHWKYADD